MTNQTTETRPQKTRNWKTYIPMSLIMAPIVIAAVISLTTTLYAS